MQYNIGDSVRFLQQVNVSENRSRTAKYRWIVPKGSDGNVTRVEGNGYVHVRTTKINQNDDTMHHVIRCAESILQLTARQLAAPIGAEGE